MLSQILPLLTKYFSYIKYGAIAMSYVAVAWGVHHYHVLAYEAEKAKHIENIANSVPEVITKTQIIYRKLKDANDPCVVSPIPAGVLSELQ